MKDKSVSNLHCMRESLGNYCVRKVRQVMPVKGSSHTTSASWLREHIFQLSKGLSPKLFLSMDIFRISIRQCKVALPMQRKSRCSVPLDSTVYSLLFVELEHDVRNFDVLLRRVLTSHYMIG